jgi:preprotein translocase subunit SecG
MGLWWVGRHCRPPHFCLWSKYWAPKAFFEKWFLVYDEAKMLAFVIVLQVLVALFLILVVLLQPGNRGGSAAALGGDGSDTVFGARGANTFLSKMTFGAAICFMVTNLALSYMSSSDKGDKSVLDALEHSAKQNAAGAKEKDQNQPETTQPASKEGADTLAPTPEGVPAEGKKEEGVKEDGNDKEPKNP